MSLTIIGRLLWKEFRVQRMLWLSLLLMGVLCAWGMRGFFSGVRHSYPFGVALSVLFTMFFAASAGSITFAIEREQETRVRLLMLRIWPLLLWLHKLVSLTLATGLLWAALFWLATLGMDRTRFGLEARTLFSAEQVRFAGCGIASGLLWGMLWSLLIRNPLSAVGLTGLSVLVTFVLTINYEKDVRASGGAYLTWFWPFGGAIGMAALALLGLWLTHRWLRACPDDGALSASWMHWRPQLLFRSGPIGLRLEWNTTADRTADVLSVERAIAEAPPSKWLARNYREVGTVWRRSFRQFVWLECHRARRFVWWTIGIVLLLIVLVKLQGPNWEGAVQSFVTLMAATHLVPLIAGLLTFRGDQSSRLFRFHVDRGVSPSAIWLSKPVVWLPVALFLAALALLGATLDSYSTPLWINSHRAAVLDTSLPDRLHDVTSLMFDGNQHGFPVANDRQPLWLHCGLLVVNDLGLFAVGLTASLLFRSGVISIVLGLVLGAVAWLWQWFLSAEGVPWLFTLLPLTAVCLALHAVRTRDWLLERDSYRDWFKAVATLLVGAMAITVGIALFRIYEIPHELHWSQPHVHTFTGGDTIATDVLIWLQWSQLPDPVLQSLMRNFQVEMSARRLGTALWQHSLYARWYREDQLVYRPLTFLLQDRQWVWPWEHPRMQRLMNNLEDADWQLFLEYHNELSQSSWNPMRPWFTGIESKRATQARTSWDRWLATTPRHPGTFDLTQILRRNLEFVTAWKATAVILKLRQHRREHGKLPERLTGVTSFNPIECDPWSGSEFIYCPEGITKAKVTDPTPFLLSLGMANPGERMKEGDPDAIRKAAALTGKYPSKPLYFLIPPF